MTPSDLDSILDALEEPVLLIGHDRRIVHANATAHELLGDVLIDQPLVRILRHPDVLRCVDITLGGEASARTQIDLPVPQPATFRVTSVRLSGSGTRNAAIALCFKDMSPLLEAAQMRSDFVANVSHELRSPLTTLSALIETLQGPAADDPEAQERFLGTMQREAHRMDRLIGDLLSLSRVEADERVRPSEAVDLLTLVHGVADMLAERGGGTLPAIDISCDGDRAMVVGDHDQLSQVFVNLLENAIKYGGETVPVRVSLELREKALGFRTPVWVATVSDEGPGVDAEHIPRLTERFYRVDAGRSRDRGGTGLGLAIVKHIVNRHRGRLLIRSEIGRGTDISVLLGALTRE